MVYFFCDVMDESRCNVSRDLHRLFPGDKTQIQFENSLTGEVAGSIPVMSGNILS